MAALLLHYYCRCHSSHFNTDDKAGNIQSRWEEIRIEKGYSFCLGELAAWHPEHNTGLLVSAKKRSCLQYLQT